MNSELHDHHEPAAVVDNGAAGALTVDRASDTSWLIVLPLRIFLAAGWLRAGIEKLIEPSWWSGDVLRSFVRDQRSLAVPLFRPLMDHAVQPAAVAVAAVVAVTEIGCGLAIASGRFIRPALRWALVLNLTFVLAGRVNPSAFYLVMQIALLLALTATTSKRISSRATVSMAAGFALGGLAMIPFVRTLEPAHVIEDPALMLLFVGLIGSAAIGMRWAAHPARTRGGAAPRMVDSVIRWSSASPAQLRTRVPRLVRTNPTSLRTRVRAAVDLPRPKGEAATRRISA